MAPEIVVGCLYNYKVDVWSVGTLLFHLLTGLYPFKGKSIEELKSSLMKGVYKIPKDVQLSVECLDFLNCCLRYDSKQRKDFTFLFDHPFILTSASSFSFKTAADTAQLNTVRTTSKLTYLHRLSSSFLASIELNTRTSIPIKELFKKFRPQQ